MTPRNNVLLVVLLAVVSLLAGALGGYAAAERALALEAGGLLSGDAFRVRATADETLEGLARSGVTAAIMKDCRDLGAVRAVTSNAIEEITIPHHDGSGFSGTRGRQAMVGDDIPVAQEGGRRTVVFAGQTYDVVARLGSGRDGPLAGQVLLHDRTLFATGEAEPLYVDGRGAKRAFIGVFGDAGVEDLPLTSRQRTNIDFVSPMLIGFGWSIVVAGWLTAGLLAGAAGRRHAGVRILMGRSRGQTIVSDAVLTGVLSVVVAGGFAAFGLIRSDPPGGWPELLALAGAAILPPVGVAFSRIQTRGVPHA